MKRALVVILNRFTHDTRVLRQVQTLTKRSHETQLFALHEGPLPVYEQREGYRLRRFQLITRSWPKRKLIQLFKYFECLVRMVWAGVEFKPELVHANDLDALPIGYVVAKITGAKLIYDSHELWSDPNATHFPRWLFKASTRVERYLCRRTDGVITVSDSISRHMSVAMQIPPPTVIRNLPDQPVSVEGESDSPLHNKTKLGTNTPILLYLGMVGRGRGLEVLVDSLQWIEGGAVAVMMGPPQTVSYLNQLKARARDLRVEGRVQFIQPVPPAEIYRYAKGAFIGICLIEDICLSYRYSLSNKLFQYLQAGVPIIVSNLPEMAKLVQEYRIGEIVPVNDASALAATLNRMLKQKSSMDNYRHNVIVAARELNWPSEEGKLLALYDRLCPQPASAT